MNKGIKAMAVFTDILRTGDVEGHMEQIKKCCSDMSKAELQDVVLEFVVSIHANCRLSVYMSVFEDAAIELDEKYNEKYNSV